MASWPINSIRSATLTATKGQEISECKYEVFPFERKNQKNSALNFMAEFF